MSAITLVEQRVIEIADSQLLSLSPDGGSIVVTRPAGPEPTELCIHDVATLAERACADVSDLDAGLWADSVVWSPDSEWLAFAELWPMFFVDGDLWLMDASTGALSNLLDDGYSGALGATSADDLDLGGRHHASDVPDVHSRQCRGDVLTQDPGSRLRRRGHRHGPHHRWRCGHAARVRTRGPERGVSQHALDSRRVRALRLPRRPAGFRAGA